MELETPPPSYELATGVPGANKQKNPFLNIPPSAQPPSQQDDEIIAEPVTTTPILPQPYNHRPTQQNGQPYNQNDYQSNRDVQPPRKVNTKTVKCRLYMIGIIITICVIAIIIGVVLGLMYGKPRSKYKHFQRSEPENVNSKDKWWKDNRELIEKLQRQTERL